MNPQVQNLVMVLGLIQVARMLNLEDPNKVFWMRIIHLTSVGIILGLCFYVRTRIKAKNDTTELMYIEPNPWSGEEPVPITTTYCDYDCDEVFKVVKQTFISLCILAFIHLKWGYVQPLFLQTFMPFKSLFESKVFQIHFFNKRAEGELKRPWKVSSPFGANSGPKQVTKKDLKRAAKAASKKDKGL
ncbi:inorganic phosphate transporter [Basidiobolus meristosporus CBS 931.73]|uniref:Inorganic phosphate transporter n=1 Tax=Basidiobolus meristosporus CBS 931.73 TaxID=1314790 RepID=A0A1Y1YIX2_9FUNG|nr:inorganic phosphate transporter [Basidiobolus meristosporus CBS 931.73]|eukprot:ORX97925.1 inorganic phosphate transporter [Basidiobolus meristosporus CBS 931.73]